MNAYVNISNELRNFFSTNKIFRYLLPLDIVIMFTGLALTFLNTALRISIGGFFSAGILGFYYRTYTYIRQF